MPPAGREREKDWNHASFSLFNNSPFVAIVLFLKRTKEAVRMRTRLQWNKLERDNGFRIKCWVSQSYMDVNDRLPSWHKDLKEPIFLLSISIFIHEQ